MAQMQTRKPQAQKIDEARDQQSKLYREIGISAVAAALRFTTQPDNVSPASQTYELPAILRGDDLAA